MVSEMGEEGVELVGIWFSPFVMRVRFALNIKGVAYQMREEKTIWNKSEFLLKCNPIYKKVPVLVHGGRPLCESLVIVQYIDEVWSSGRRSILPADSLDRAVARFWAFYIDDKCFPSIIEIIGAATQEVKEKAAERLSTSLGELEAVFDQLSGKKSFFGGDEIGLVDIMLGFFLVWIKALERVDGVQILSEAEQPNLATWADRFCSHDSIKEIMPSVEAVMEAIEQIRMGPSA